MAALPTRVLYAICAFGTPGPRPTYEGDMSAVIEHGAFAGAVRSRRTVQGTLLAETTYGSGQHVGLHVHDRAILCLVLDGAFVEQRERGTDRLLPGDLLYHPGAEIHGHDFVAQCRLFNVQASRSWLADAHALPLPSAPRVIRHGIAPWYARRLSLESTRTDTAAPLAIEAALLSLVAELARVAVVRERRAPAWLPSVLEALDAFDVGASPVPTLSELARIANVHPAHLARAVKQFIGCSVGTYVRRRRLARARVALARTAIPLSMVAADAGFCDQAHFTRVFRSEFGATPGAYRNASVS
jgi:AraC family transcriptional regulator